MSEIKDKKEEVKIMENCPECGKKLECKKEKEIYVCHNCMEIYRNRGYGFEMYEKLGSAMYLALKNAEEIEKIKKII